jgi:hypothetical protein
MMALQKAVNQITLPSIRQAMPNTEANPRKDRTSFRQYQRPARCPDVSEGTIFNAVSFELDGDRVQEI